MGHMGKLVLVLFVCLSLTACKSEQEQANDAALKIRSGILENAPHLTASVTADYGDRVYDFTLSYDAAAGVLTVLEPEILAGITVQVTNGSTALKFDGVELNTGPLTEDGLTPVSALPVIVTAWKQGYITEAYYEKLDDVQTVVLATSLSDTVTHTTWFDAGTYQPVKSEIASDGYAVIQCRYTVA